MTRPIRLSGGRLPDGTCTRSERRYIREWRRVGRIVARVLGPDWYPMAFDPGLSIGHKGGRSAIEVPMVLAMAIVRLVETGKDVTR